MKTRAPLAQLGAVCFVLLSSTHAVAQFVQQAHLISPNSLPRFPSHSFGHSVALSANGNTAIVGEPNNDDALIWERTGGTWSSNPVSAEFLRGTGRIGGSGQGWSVALSGDGNTAMVGGNADNGKAGAVWVWIRNATGWTQQAKLVASDAAGAAQQGYSVSLSRDGNTAIVGGPGDNNNAGAAWIWKRTGGTWTQQGNKLVGTGAAANAQQGSSVALSADATTAIVGGMNESPTGAAWIWINGAGVWREQGPKLVGSGNAGFSLQGESVSISAYGDTALVGGPGDAGNQGAAWVWTRSGGIWTQQGSKLVGSGALSGITRQGYAVSLSSDGNTAIVTGPDDDYPSVVGAAWAWKRAGGLWTQQGAKIPGLAYSARQGVSAFLSADASTFIVGGDSHALVFFRTQSDIDPSTIPAMSGWFLLILACVLALIGMTVTRF